MTPVERALAVAFGVLLSLGFSWGVESDGRGHFARPLLAALCSGSIVAAGAWGAILNGATWAGVACSVGAVVAAVFTLRAVREAVEAAASRKADGR